MVYVPFAKRNSSRERPIDLSERPVDRRTVIRTATICRKQLGILMLRPVCETESAVSLPSWNIRPDGSKPAEDPASVNSPQYVAK